MFQIGKPHYSGTAGRVRGMEALGRARCRRDNRKPQDCRTAPRKRRSRTFGSQVGQTIAFGGLSCPVKPGKLDRRQKPIVCPTRSPRRGLPKTTAPRRKVLCPRHIIRKPCRTDQRFCGLSCPVKPGKLDRRHKPIVCPTGSPRPGLPKTTAPRRKVLCPRHKIGMKQRT